MLKIINFSKTYKGGKIGAKNVNIHVMPGDIYGFIGHNGSGKTTTLKSVAGLLNFEEGEIYVNGISVKADPIACKKVIAYLPDNPDLYDALTGVAYVNFIADVFEVPADLRNERISKYADLLGMSEDITTPINSYSHGMKQKLALISALVHRPKLLLLDEPFVGLDPQASFRLREIMHELCAEGSSIFFSTHVLEVAEKLCNKVAIIKKGEIIISGETKDITRNSSLENLFLELT